MTLRSVTTPYDPKTYAEYQGKIAALIGVPVASWSTAAATEFNRSIEDAHERVTKKYGHEPWTQQELSGSLASGTATVVMPAYVRTLIEITETYGGVTRIGRKTTKRDYFAAWNSGATSHPWNSQQTPYWFFDGPSDDSPPRAQWKRVPTPDAAITYSILLRPYLSLVGTDSYGHIPAFATAAIDDFVCFRVLMILGMTERAAMFKSSFEDEMNENTKNDTPDGAWEAAREIEAPTWVFSEMGGP